MTCDDSARMVIPHLNGPSPITTRSVSPAQVSPVITITNKVQNRQAVVVDICSIVRLRMVKNTEKLYFVVY